MGKMTALRRAFVPDDRGVSEIIGYTLAFTIALTTIVAVSLASGPIIDSARSDEATTAMKHNFNQLDSEIQSVQTGAETGEYSGEIPAGQLRQLRETTVTFSQSGTDFNISLQPIHYQTGEGDEVMYTGVFTAQREGGTRQNGVGIMSMGEPSYMSENPVLVVPGIVDNGEQSTVASTRATSVSFAMEKMNPAEPPRTQTFKASNGDVSVTVSSELPGAWAAYFERHPAVTNVAVTGSSDVEATIVLDGSSRSRVTVVSQKMVLRFTT